MTIRVMSNTKGPYTKVPLGEGYGYLGAILYDDVQDRVQCHACGKWYKAVNEKHVQRCSGRSLREHKVAYGLPSSKRPLCRPETSRKHRVQMPQRVEAGMRPLKAGSERAREISELGKKARASRNSMFTRNKHSKCPAQLRDALLQIAEENGGRIPSSTKLPYALTAAIRWYYGSYNRGVRILGLANREKWEKYADEELLAALRDLKTTLGRSPTKDDCGGEFPSATAYYAHFGSWSNAKKLAGV